jgi:hypothetical protein
MVVGIEGEMEKRKDKVIEQIVELTIKYSEIMSGDEALILALETIIEKLNEGKTKWKQKADRLKRPLNVYVQ